MRGAPLVQAENVLDVRKKTRQKMEIERNLDQSEWAGFTVTKKRSNKSAPALRTVNPRSSIFTIQPAAAKLLKLLFCAALWN